MEVVGSNSWSRLATWFNQRPRLLMALKIALALIVVVHLAVTIHRNAKHPGDMEVNREFGRRFLVGEDLYAGGCCFNYMPTAAMYWAPLAMVPPKVAIIARYFVGLASLTVALVLLGRMVRRDWSSDSFNARSPALPLGLIAAVTLILGSHYVIRDLDDGGPHLVYVALLVGGIYLAWQGRNVTSALCLSLPIAVKLTPGLVLPFLVWKRRWRLAAWAIACTLFWTVLPAVWMGPADWWHAQSQFNRVALSVVGNSGGAMRDDNELRVQNQNLKFAVLRGLTTYPSNHPLRLNHAAYRDALDLSPKTAGKIALVVMLAIFAACAWRSRAAYAPLEDAHWLPELSGLMLLMVLLSPVTWLQHLVLVLPALYVVVTAIAANPRGTRGLSVALGIYAVCVLVLNRELLGKENYLLLLSYHLHTLATLLLLGMVLSVKVPTRRARSEDDRQSPPVPSSVTTLRARAA